MQMKQAVNAINAIRLNAIDWLFPGNFKKNHRAN
jgi:hypothetical protein